MKEWADKGELVERLAQARRDARETGPRHGNDHLEAAMFLAMCFALEAVNQEAEAQTEPSLETPAVLTEAETDQPQEEDDGEPEPDPEPARPARRRGARAASDGGEGDQQE